MTNHNNATCRILTVCVGNICRSPMAAGFFQQLATRTGAAILVESAGLDAMVGYPADKPSKTVASRFGVDLSEHRGKQLNRHLITQADLILTAESWQKKDILAMAPDTRGKLFTLGHWADIEIADPYKKSRATYAECVAQIKLSVDSWSKHIC